MVEPAPIDPPEIEEAQWEGFVGGVGWDVGANLGQSIEMMRSRFGHVHCFEPGVEALRILGRRTALDVTVWPLALTAQDGPVELLALPEKLQTGQLVTSAWPVEWSESGAEVRKVCGMRATSMARLIGAPDFMKIDVEGHEVQVLRGALRLLTRSRPGLLIEIHSVELGVTARSFLESLAYQVTEIRHPYYEVGSDFWRGHYWLRAVSRIPRLL